MSSEINNGALITAESAKNLASLPNELIPESGAKYLNNEDR